MSSLAEIENDLDYLLFVDHAESMEGYTHLRPVLDDVAKLVQRHIDRAVEQAKKEVTYEVAKRLKESVGEIVMAEPEVDTTSW